jgi:hypothetical protein
MTELEEAPRSFGEGDVLKEIAGPDKWRIRSWVATADSFATWRPGVVVIQIYGTAWSC